MNESEPKRDKLEWESTSKMNLSRKNRTEGNKRAKKGRIKKSSYAGYDSFSQSMEPKISVKPIWEIPLNYPGKQTVWLSVDHECKQRHSSLFNAHKLYYLYLCVWLLCYAVSYFRDSPVMFWLVVDFEDCPSCFYEFRSCHNFYIFSLALTKLASWDCLIVDWESWECGQDSYFHVRRGGAQESRLRESCQTATWNEAITTSSIFNDSIYNLTTVFQIGHNFNLPCSIYNLKFWFKIYILAFFF